MKPIKQTAICEYEGCIGLVELFYDNLSRLMHGKCGTCHCEYEIRCETQIGEPRLKTKPRRLPPLPYPEEN